MRLLKNQEKIMSYRIIFYYILYIMCRLYKAVRDSGGFGSSRAEVQLLGALGRPAQGYRNH